jgi:hypothetical protein
MKTTKTQIIAVTAGLLLSATQFSYAATGQGWNDSVHDFGPWSTAVYSDSSDVTSPELAASSDIGFLTEYAPDRDMYQTLGYGIFHTDVGMAQADDQDMPMYVDLNADSAAVPSGLLNTAQFAADEYVLYPQSQSDTQFVQYGHAENGGGAELNGDFVVGPLTSIATLNDFQNGQVVAVYFGSTFTHSAFTSVTANFGTGTWSGIFLGEFDVAVSGAIEGQFFSSDTVTGFRNSSTPVSGMVAGSFYGPDADEIAGVIDITRNGERIVDLFDGQKVDINLPAN